MTSFSNYPGTNFNEKSKREANTCSQRKVWENVKNSLFETVLKAVLQKHIKSFLCAAVELYFSDAFRCEFAFSLLSRLKYRF